MNDTCLGEGLGEFTGDRIGASCLLTRGLDLIVTGALTSRISIKFLLITPTNKS